MGEGCQKYKKECRRCLWMVPNSLKEILETRTKKIMNSLIRWEKYADPLRFSLEYFPWKCSNWSERVMHQRSKSFAFGSWLLKLLGSKRNLSGNSIWTNYISARICKNFVILTLIIMSSNLIFALHSEAALDTGHFFHTSLTQSPVF